MQDDEFIPTRQTLLSRLKDWEDHDSWSEFFETYWPLIYKAAIKSGLSDAEAQDVVQETIISVSKKMPQFKYDPSVGSFKGWLLKLTRWRIADHCRNRHPGARQQASHFIVPADEVNLEDIPNPEGCDLESLWNEEWETTLFNAAIERVKRQVDPKQFQIFHLHVLKEWPLRKVAAALNISAGRVYIAKYRISAKVKKEFKHLEEQML
jgi:RNA polymerase sigma factor (sigma-70 family)